MCGGTYDTGLNMKSFGKMLDLFLKLLKQVQCYRSVITKQSRVLSNQICLS